MSATAALRRGAIDPEDASIVSAFVISATFWLLLATAVGVLLSFKFPYPDLATSPFLSFGRLRAIHTNDTFYGWASIALSAVAIFVASRTSGIPIAGKKYAWASLWLYNIAAVLGTITLDLGINYGDQEYREWVWPIRIVFLVAALLSSMSVIETVRKRVEHELYISNWYFIAAFVYAAILTIVSIIPVYQHGLGQITISGYFMHNAVGMWFTFLALGATYYALPKSVNRPIYSYSLGVLAFWTNTIFYPVIGAHHFEFTPVPWCPQTPAIVFSVGMIVPVWSSVANFAMTLRRDWDTVRRSYVLPFIVAGVAWYAAASTQGTFEAIRSVQQMWHFSQYTIGHSHAAMYGFITFLTWGGIYAVLPRATGKEPNRLAVGLHFWFALIGVLVYVIALSIGGTLQGLSWVEGKPFVASIDASMSFDVLRAVGGSLMLLAHFFFAYNVYQMTFAPKSAPDTLLAVSKTPVEA